MKAVYIDSAVPEKEAKVRYNFPECVMMENAAMALEKAVKSAFSEINKNLSKKSQILIICGGGNNGADGLALSRRLFPELNCTVTLLKEPKTKEAEIQFKMAQSTGVNFCKPEELENFSSPEIIVDCIYGSGFHGILSSEDAKIISKLNSFSSYRIACDIPSGISKSGQIETVFNNEKLAFKADETVTMGSFKLALFTDDAKNFTGKITRANLGISSIKFQECANPDAFLLEKDDMLLPVRKLPSSHKGNFGHTAIILGEKAGAGILAGSAALKIGSGLVSCIDKYNISSRFKMNPELMISDTIPDKANTILAGSGLGRNQKKVSDLFHSLIIPYTEKANPSIVFDADAFYAEEFPLLLQKLDQNPDAKVILTPHPREFHFLVNKLNLSLNQEKNQENFDEVVNNRFFYAKLFGEKFKNAVLISKGAVNYIVQGEKIYIVSSGSQALAKAGSGDVLAGLCAGLLSQNYNVLEAAKTAVLIHAEASHMIKNNFSLTPLKLISLIEKL